MGRSLLLLKGGLGMQWGGQDLFFKIVAKDVFGAPWRCVSGTFAPRTVKKQNKLDDSVAYIRKLCLIAQQKQEAWLLCNSHTH